MRVPAYLCMRVYVANGFVEGKAVQFSYRNVERSLERFVIICYNFSYWSSFVLTFVFVYIYVQGRAHVQ